MAPGTSMTSPGTPSEKWCQLQWRRMFETYIIAANLGAATAERKRAILLHSLGPEGQRLFYTLPDPAPINDDNVYLQYSVH